MPYTYAQNTYGNQTQSSMWNGIITTGSNICGNYYTTGTQATTCNIFVNYGYQPTSVTLGSYTYPEGVDGIQGQICYNYLFNVLGSQTQTFEETPEQKIVREEQEVKRIAASKRAEELLFMCLSEEQQKQYLELGYFETQVNDKTYRINKGRAGNVYLIEKGKAKCKYCAHPYDYTPEQDAMLAQLLMLTTDEERFIKTANRTELYG